MAKRRVSSTTEEDDEKPTAAQTPEERRKQRKKGRAARKAGQDRNDEQLASGRLRRRPGGGRHRDRRRARDPHERELDPVPPAHARPRRRIGDPGVPPHNTTDFGNTWCPNGVNVVLDSYPYLTISIGGTTVSLPTSIGRNSTYPGGQACDLPVETQPASSGNPAGTVDIVSPWAFAYNLSTFFTVWSQSYANVYVNSSHASQPIVYQPNDLLGFTSDASHSVRLFVDGSPSSAGPSLGIDTLDYGPNPYPSCIGQKYGTGHHILLTYSGATAGSAGAKVIAPTLATGPAVLGLGPPPLRLPDAPLRVRRRRADGVRRARARQLGLARRPTRGLAGSAVPPCRCARRAGSWGPGRPRQRHGVATMSVRWRGWTAERSTGIVDPRPVGEVAGPRDHRAVVQAEPLRRRERRAAPSLGHLPDHPPEPLVARDASAEHDVGLPAVGQRPFGDLGQHRVRRRLDRVREVGRPDAVGVVGEGGGVHPGERHVHPVDRVGQREKLRAPLRLRLERRTTRERPAERDPQLVEEVPDPDVERFAEDAVPAGAVRDDLGVPPDA